MMRIRVPHLLLALSVVPLLGGAMRLSALTGADQSSPVDRFSVDPWPVVLHIVAASFYAVVGAFQFDDHLRKTRPIWHRRAGRVVAVGGFIAAISGLWMTIAYPIPAPLQGELLYLVRIVVGTAMAAFVVLGVHAIVNHNLRRHQAWMVRAYALAQGAGTQVFLLLPPALLLGSEVTGPLRDFLMVAAWLLNATVAELIIARCSAGHSQGTAAIIGGERSGGQSTLLQAALNRPSPSVPTASPPTRRRPIRPVGRPRA